jgi:hypothetical protein
MSTTRHYDLYSHEFRVTTHEAYARMREESPVHRQPGLDGDLVRHAHDVVALLTDNERFVLDPRVDLDVFVAGVAPPRRLTTSWP